MADAGKGEDGAKAKPKQSFYDLLGVNKVATEKQIVTAYRKLALKYHPDRNQGSEEAAEKFKEISTAYAVLSDPNKRRQYDLTGESPDILEQETVDMEAVGGMARVFGAMMNKLGIPIPTKIGQTTLNQAQEICKEGFQATGGAEADGGKFRVLRLGLPVSGRTERQGADFFVIRVTPEEESDGIIITCSSANRSRFKVVLFDSYGRVRYVEESTMTVDKKLTSASLYLVPFETTTLGDPFPIMDQETPQLFARLSMLMTTRREIKAGDHLFCIYGDNFLQRTQYCVTALRAKTSSVAVERVKEIDAAITKKKDELENLQEEYVIAKEKFDNLVAKTQEEAKTTAELVQARENAYNLFIGESLNQYSQLHAEEAQRQASEASSSSGGGFQSFFSDLLGGGRR